MHLVQAAAGQSAIPFLFGKIITAVAIETVSTLHKSSSAIAVISVSDCCQDDHDFHKYMLYLVITALVTGIFTGFRGSSFIVVC